MVIEAVPRTVGFLYGLVMIGILVWLWRSGRWNRKIGGILLLMSAALGFLIFAPVMPYQFEQAVLRNEGALEAPVAVAVIGISVLTVISLLIGRFFCGYICPAGAVQEIAYHAPVPKTLLKAKVPFMAVRAIFFVVFLAIAFVTGLSLLSFFGIHDFFYLIFSAGSVAFLIVLIISTTVYRPFCRLFCPAGLVFSLVAWKSIFRLGRTGACIECGKCEKACPADEAGGSDRKAECYLCGRCLAVCPKDAIRYGREPGKEMAQKED